jgi:hypothetical protein
MEALEWILFFAGCICGVISRLMDNIACCIMEALVPGVCLVLLAACACVLVGQWRQELESQRKA